MKPNDEMLWEWAAANPEAFRERVEELWTITDRVDRKRRFEFRAAALAGFEADSERAKTRANRTIPDPRACGTGKGDDCCIYLVEVSGGGFRCGRDDRDEKATIETRAPRLTAKRKPGEAWPACLLPIRRTAYWITGGTKGGCVEAQDEAHAIEIARAHGCEGDLVARRLPYPATPRLGPWWITPGLGPTPAFCWAPSECAGRSACPKRPSCVD